ncbi:hypothetical protein ACUTAF_04670 [Pseudomonas sp. SP16.1]|uniref:hypothetical protein n=1 Tax=Pseudomonas sp. SP16.1 TaxID=3458854 RepID=UPI0040460D2C
MSRRNEKNGQLLRTLPHADGSASANDRVRQRKARIILPSAVQANPELSPWQRDKNYFAEGVAKVRIAL